MERILIVEDDRPVQKALKRLFESEGYDVDIRGDGAAGLEAFRDSSPAAVILDLHLPLVSGTDVCREIRQQSSTVPIVILSAATEVLEKVLLLELGADDYVTKPFSPRELLARVRAAIRHTPKSIAHDLAKFDGVCIDFTSMEVTFDGHPVVLTALEFKILRFFVQNAERVISRTEILKHAFGYQVDPASHTVDDHIFHLRQKLERDPANPIHFLTVHRVGYKFVA